MTTNTKTNENTATKAWVNDLELASLTTEQLREQARLRKVTLTSNDKADMIDEIISAGVEQPTAAKAGSLISLHSRTDEAKALINAARNVMTKNEAGKKTFTLFLQSREGQFYNQKFVPGCRVSPERLQDVIAITSPLPDGSQNELLVDVVEHPEKYEEPLLVRLPRRNQDGSSAQYVMLYIKLKQKLVEEKF